MTTGERRQRAITMSVLLRSPFRRSYRLAQAPRPAAPQRRRPPALADDKTKKEFSQKRNQRRPGPKLGPVSPRRARLPLARAKSEVREAQTPQLQALGHTVRLMPPAYVKPYVKRQKNDATDAEAICEAVTRANMRFVPAKTPEQRSMRSAMLGRWGKLRL